MCKIKEFDIELRTTGDCELINSVLKNTTIIGELYSAHYENCDHMKCTLYVTDEQYDTLITMFPAFVGVEYDEYELEDTAACDMVDQKKNMIDDIHSLYKIYHKLEQMHDKYTIMKLE